MVLAVPDPKWCIRICSWLASTLAVLIETVSVKQSIRMPNRYSTFVLKLTRNIYNFTIFWGRYWISIRYQQLQISTRYRLILNISYRRQYHCKLSVCASIVFFLLLKLDLDLSYSTMFLKSCTVHVIYKLDQGSKCFPSQVTTEIRPSIWTAFWSSLCWDGLHCSSLLAVVLSWLEGSALESKYLLSPLSLRAPY